MATAGSFPQDFIFGVATSAYQIEGAWNENGKSESNWDYITHKKPGIIKDGSNGDIACDSYHKIDEDLKIIRNLGVQSYRFSLAWSRILPDGFANNINADGIRYYNELIDGLLRNNISPSITIYHWDHPQSLQDLGGWTNPIMIDLYLEYAKVAFKYFGDRVKHWVTFNEPLMFCGRIRSRNPCQTVASEGCEQYLCAHTILKAHAKAYYAYKNEFADQKGQIGIVLNIHWHEPKTDRSEDIAAAKRAIEFDLGLYANPIFSKEGDYPAIVKERVAYVSAKQNFTKSRLPEFTADEINEIRGTSDFFGINHYSTDLISESSQDSLKASYEDDIHADKSYDPSWPGSEVPPFKTVPWGMHRLLMYIKDTYDNPIVYITENGHCEYAMQDNGRLQYYKGYLENVAKAIADGCKVAGYYAWSLMDNFEWYLGYTVHFGLHHVDFTDPNRPRTPRASALWYRDFIQSAKNGVKESCQQ